MQAVIAGSHCPTDSPRLLVGAPLIAEIRKPGQCVIVHRAPGAERIPLTIADADPDRGTITLVIQAVGKSTEDRVALRPGEAIADVAGPLGKGTELIDHGRAGGGGEGGGRARGSPIALGGASAGGKVISVVGGSIGSE